MIIWSYLCGFAVCAGSAISTMPKAVDLDKKEAETAAAIIGRWDLVVQDNGGTFPSWLEVSKSGHSSLVGRFVGHFGSARPIGNIRYKNGRLSFAIPPQWESGNGDLKFQGRIATGKLTGSIVEPDGTSRKFTGTPAPLLKRFAGAKWEEPMWGEPIELFNGRNTNGWKPRNPSGENNWSVVNGSMLNVKSGTDIVTEQKFTDFQLVLEFKYPKESNSGIYLRGRYEVQIEDNFGLEPDSHLIGGVYGFLTPRVNSSRKAGEWQEYRITLIGRYVTVYLNGELIINQQEIPGITGGALDSKEGEPGPILIQGDHGAIEFRKIVITPAKSAH